ncbi:MAG: DUF1993 domain-containing protein [Maricaulaceae bacterium]|jgi:hypothetical protein
MKVDLFEASVGVFARGLHGFRTVLDKGAAFAESHGIEEADLLAAKLYPNMLPLRRQAQIVCDFAWKTPARAAGLEFPGELEGESSLADIRTRIEEAQAFLGSLTPAQFEGRDEEPVTFPLGPENRTMPAGQYVLGFATPNFYFHYMAAYAILRHLGVGLGKLDYFGAPG